MRVALLRMNDATQEWKDFLKESSDLIKDIRAEMRGFYGSTEEHVEALLEMHERRSSADARVRLAQLFAIGALEDFGSCFRGSHEVAPNAP
ncbi:MAG: hypothetical protein F4Y01_10000 [Gammaproteobacteria bacterium]|nr:hypothetical protein [Gammaproteobacteria bacterium]